MPIHKSEITLPSGRKLYIGTIMPEKTPKYKLGQTVNSVNVGTAIIKDIFFSRTTDMFVYGVNILSDESPGYEDTLFLYSEEDLTD